MVGWLRQLDGCEFEQLRELAVDRAPWHTAVRGAGKNWTGLSAWTELGPL